MQRLRLNVSGPDCNFGKGKPAAVGEATSNMEGKGVGTAGVAADIDDDGAHTIEGGEGPIEHRVCCGPSGAVRTVAEQRQQVDVADIPHAPP
jgi:hypothetical protein